MRSIRFTPFRSLIILLALGVIVSACGGGGGSGGAASGTGTFLASGKCISPSDSEAAGSIMSSDGDSSSAPVPAEEIERLTVTVTEVALQQCDGSDHDDDADDLVVVEVGDSTFNPTAVTVEQGGKVRWVWRENQLHTITSGTAGKAGAGLLFNESADSIGSVVELTFDGLGFFPYFSNIGADIAAGMTGSVNVVPDEDGLSPLVGDVPMHAHSKGRHLTIFSGALELEVTELTALSELLTSVDIPAGRYCKIRLRIEDPRLVLASDPDTVLTNVHLTANGRLFIGTKFTIKPGGENIVLVDFGCIHLIDAGSSGKFVLTPQLRADVNVAGADVRLEGELISIDCVTGMLTFVSDFGNEFEAILDSETLFEDELGEPIDCEDLEPGDRVEVEGFLTAGGIIEADEVERDND